MNINQLHLRFLVALVLTGFQSLSFAQTCSLTVSGTVNWSTAGWTCSGGASAPTTNGGVFNGDLFVTLNNGAKLITDISLTLNGDLNLVSNGSCELQVDSNETLDINGDFDAADENNLTITVDGTLQVDGLMEVKNSNSFGGSGTISGDSLIVKNNNGCAAGGCPNLAFPFCQDGNNNFCADNVSSTALEIEVNKISYDKDKQLIIWETHSAADILHCHVEWSSSGWQWNNYATFNASKDRNIHQVFLDDHRGYFRGAIENSEGELSYSNVLELNTSNTNEGLTKNKIAVISQGGDWGIINRSAGEIEFSIFGLTGDLFISGQLKPMEIQTLDESSPGAVIIQYRKLNSSESAYQRLIPFH